MESVNTNIVAVPTVRVDTQPESTTNVPSYLSPDNKEQPFSIYAQENKMPYTVKYFGMDRMDYNALQIADVNNLTSKMDDIENYISNLITKEGHKDSTQTYKEVLQEIKEQLGIKDYESKERQIDKISKFISKQVKTPKLFNLKSHIKPKPRTFNNFRSLADFIHKV